MNTLPFHNFAEFVAMGKHGAYVWSAWGITLLAVAVFVVISVQSRKKFIANEQLRYKRIQQNKNTNTH